MADIKTNIKRQVEILGLVLAHPDFYSIQDFEVLFNCSTVTIKRDLSELRGEGINIHSVPKKGIRIEGKIPSQTLHQLLEMYVLLSQMEGEQNKAAAFLIESKHENAVVFMVAIQRCIENKSQIEILYRKTPKNIEKKIVSPLILFEKDNSWRLLGIEDDTWKQFVVEKIVSVNPLSTKFINTDNSFRELVKNAFGPWIGEPIHKVKLKFTKSWLASGKTPQMVAGQKAERQKDGSTIVDFSVCYLEDVARWVVARGGEVVALDPPELKEMIISISQATYNEQKSCL